MVFSQNSLNLVGLVVVEVGSTSSVKHSTLMLSSSRLVIDTISSMLHLCPPASPQIGGP